jgi:hypothetical protein
MDIYSAIEALRSFATFSPEYEGENIFVEIKDSYERLLDSYPRLKSYSTYLNFLKFTGGAHIHNQDFSLGIYGFGGYVVASFEEGLFLDQDRYFQFGEVLYHAEPDLVYVFAFDLDSKKDMVYISPIDQTDYIFSCISFIQLLNNFASGQYPLLKT